MDSKAYKEGFDRGASGCDSPQGLFSAFTSSLANTLASPDAVKAEENARGQGYRDGIQTKANNEAMENATEEIKAHISQNMPSACSENSTPSDNYDCDYYSGDTGDSKSTAVGPRHDYVDSIVTGFAIFVPILVILFMTIFVVPVDPPNDQRSLLQWFIARNAYMNQLEVLSDEAKNLGKVADNKLKEYVNASGSELSILHKAMDNKEFSLDDSKTLEKVRLWRSGALARYDEANRIYCLAINKFLDFKRKGF